MFTGSGHTVDDSGRRDLMPVMYLSRIGGTVPVLRIPVLRIPVLRISVLRISVLRIPVLRIPKCWKAS